MAHPSIHPYSITAMRNAGRIDRRIERMRRYECRQAIIEAWMQDTDDELRAVESSEEWSSVSTPPNFPERVRKWYKK